MSPTIFISILPQFIQKYQHLCKLEKKLIEWKDDVYEYQPPFYVKTFCKNIYESDNNKQEQQVKLHTCNVSD